MSPRRTLAITRKEFLHIIRDPRSLGMGVAIPMMMLILYGYALTLDVDKVPTIVWDQSRSKESRQLISRFSGSRYFSVGDYVQSYQQIEQAIDSGQAILALIIPQDFAARIRGGRRVRVQLIADGSNSNTATIAIGYATSVMQGYSQAVMIDRISRSGGSLIMASGSRGFAPAVDLRPRVWFNADLKSRNFIIPGLIAVIMMVVAALLTSLTIAREWETGTMEQLISTPVSAGELILGKFLPYFAIGMFDVLVAILMGQFVFRVPLRGSAALLFGMAAVFLAGSLSLGLLISIVTKSQLLASQLAMLLTLLPSFLLSGFVFAIANMPRLLQFITYLIPARYFVTLVRGIYLKGVGLEILGLEAALLALFGLSVVILARLKFKKKLE
ncbi:MAG: ABC transporter permease [bacterium]|nr:ABC transporter permease [bacterium]